MSHQSVSEPLAATPSLRLDGLPLADAHSAGGKASGLLRLNPGWYPPTVVLLPTAHTMYRDGRLAHDFLEARTDISRLLLSVSSGSPTAEVYLRSNARVETVSERGRFQSHHVLSDARVLQSAIVDSWDRELDSAVELGFLLQPRLEVKAAGHMSNEYRVSRDATSWITEFDGWKGERQPGSWRVHTASPAPNGPLTCTRSGDIEKTLRAVAKRLSELPMRHHLEWIWDGSRVWIVQADVVAPTIGAAPGAAWVPTTGQDIGPRDLSVWKHCSELGDKPELSEWPKASALQEFASADLPVADLWRLDGASTIAALSGEQEVPGLAEDLEVICSGHVVVRTDIRHGGEHLMLSKTGPTVDAQELLAWLSSTTSQLLGEGHKAADISFLAHRFLASRASAWVLARPGQPFVNVASIWGTPDGLAWLPHDRAWVNTETSEVRRSIGGKTSFLDINEQGEWTYRESPSEWIWRASASEDELRVIATGSRRLADQLGEPTLTMWFVGVQGGGAYHLPWFRMPPPDSDAGAATSISPQSARVIVGSASDLLRFEEQHVDAKGMVLRVMPQREFVRDSAFVDQIAAVASKSGAAVEIVGSSLAHPYYVLRRAGVTVVCLDAFKEPAAVHNKLVRDGIVRHIADGGEAVTAYIATGSDLTARLRRKVVEEAIELLETDDGENAVEEMADLSEVLEALREALGYDRELLGTVQAAKRASRGGFGSGAVLLRTGGTQAAPGVSASVAVPLFEDDPSWEAPWQVRQVRNHLEVNCVPPLAHEPRRFRVHIAGVDLYVEYRGSSIELTLASASSLENSDATLFD